MRKQQRLIVLIVGMVAAIAPHPAQAQEKTSLNPPVLEIEQPLTEAKWLTQASPPTEAVKEQVAQVTAVQLKLTEKGLEVILETAAEFPEVLTSSAENSLITDIPNAQLRLPGGRAFLQDNPTQAIASVEVTNLDAKTLRVTVTGKAGVPTAEVSQSPQALILSVIAPPAPAPQPTPTPTPPAAPEPKPQAEEELQLEVRAEEEAGGYNVPDATTATKTDTPLRDIPQSIEVIPKKVIEDQGVTRISDALRNVSSVTKRGGFGDDTDSFDIRGFETSDSLRNGFRIQAPIISPTNIERIEVLKGPASVLYGQFQPGGVVNYITKQPLSEPYYSGEFAVGSYDFFRPSIDISGPLTLDQRLSYRLNAAYETAGSFVDFVDSETLAIAPTLSYKIGDDTTVTLDYEYTKLDRVFYDGFPPNPIIFDLPISRFLEEPDINNLDQESNNVLLALNHRFSENLQLRSAFAAYLYDTSVRYVAPTPDLEEDGRTLLRRFIPSDTLSYSEYSLQTDLIGKFNTGFIQHQVLLGFDWSKYSYGTDYFENVAGSPIDIFDPVYGSPQPTELDSASRSQEDRNTIGIYLQDQITLLPNLKLLVGSRVDFLNRETLEQELDSEGTPIGDPNTENLYETPFSPRVGIVYQPIEPISLYASYSRSFVPNSARTVEGQFLPPERGTQYEVGVKAETLEGKLSATLAAYEITKTNVATIDPDNPEFSIAAGEVKSRGVELDVAGEISPGWNVITSFFVNDAFISEDNDPTLVDEKLVNAPGVGASLWTTYEIQTGDLQGLGVGAGLFFVGDREAELPNTFNIPSYVRADATIFYQRDNWRIGLNFKNLTSTKYYDSQGFWLLPGAPFTVLGTVSVQF